MHTITAMLTAPMCGVVLSVLQEGCPVTSVHVYLSSASIASSSSLRASLAFSFLNFSHPMLSVGIDAREDNLVSAKDALARHSSTCFSSCFFDFFLDFFEAQLRRLSPS